MLTLSLLMPLLLPAAAASGAAVLPRLLSVVREKRRWELIWVSCTSLRACPSAYGKRHRKLGCCLLIFPLPPFRHIRLKLYVRAGVHDKQLSNSAEVIDIVRVLHTYVCVRITQSSFFWFSVVPVFTTVPPLPSPLALPLPAVVDENLNILKGLRFTDPSRFVYPSISNGWRGRTEQPSCTFVICSATTSTASHRGAIPSSRGSMIAMLPLTPTRDKIWQASSV